MRNHEHDAQWFSSPLRLACGCPLCCCPGPVLLLLLRALAAPAPGSGFWALWPQARNAHGAAVRACRRFAMEPLALCCVLPPSACPPPPVCRFALFPSATCLPTWCLSVCYGCACFCLVCARLCLYWWHIVCGLLWCKCPALHAAVAALAPAWLCCVSPLLLRALVCWCALVCSRLLWMQLPCL